MEYEDSALKSQLDTGVDDYNVNIPKADMNGVLVDIEKWRIRSYPIISSPRTFLSINRSPISTAGNITLISGASKSGKSALLSFIIAMALKDDGLIEDGLEFFEVAGNINRYAVIHVDTEQSKHKHQAVLIATLRRAGITEFPENFFSCNIREEELENYNEVTNAICEAAMQKYNGIHLIIIDGIADYVSDVNDNSQSAAIVKYFESLSIKYDCPLITILHTNPGSNKERGHLGSQLQRKAESVLGVESENDISRIEPKFLRNASKANIPIIQYKYNIEKGYHISYGIATVEEEKKKLLEIVNAVFKDNTAYKYNQAIQFIKEYSQIGETTAKGHFKKIKELGLVMQGSGRLYSRKQQ